VHIAAGQIQLGAGEVFIAAGVESMSRVPMMGFNPLPNPVRCRRRCPGAYIGMGDTAENVAAKWHISRAEQEAFAVRSQQRAPPPRPAYFADEIVPITAKGGTSIRTAAPGPTPPPRVSPAQARVQQDGTVTAGTSSPLTDGASALLVCSEDYARKNGLTPLARIVSVAVAGCAPEIMGIGPVAATQEGAAARRPRRSAPTSTSSN
jgi:acetyl-CoA acyltransferase